MAIIVFAHPHSYWRQILPGDVRDAFSQTITRVLVLRGTGPSLFGAPSDTPDSCWFVAGNAHNRNALFDSQSIATSVSAPTMQLATCPLRFHQKVATNQLPLPLRADLHHPLTAVKSP
jgi:hypothetical protein